MSERVNIPEAEMELMLQVLAELKPTPHPLLPWFTPQEMRSVLLEEGGEEMIVRLFQEREEKIRMALADPLTHGFELDHWKDADALLFLQTLFLIILGGNRSGKSEYAAKRMVQACVNHSRCRMICLSEDMEASKVNQQSVIWKYLPNQWKALKNRRDPSAVFKINYSEANGFTEGLVVFPNFSRIHFKSYNEDPGEVEGWMFGHPDVLTVGAWADERLRLNWFRMFERRLRFQPAHLLWAYTPILGMTPVIKAAVGKSAKTIESRFAELLPNRVNVPGLPVGHMPYIQESSGVDRGRVIYFFSQYNAFGAQGRSFYEGVKENVKGKSSEIVMRVAYGYTTDTQGQSFPLFGEWNIEKEGHHPKAGTMYHLSDPASARNWANLWVIVTPGSETEREYHFVRDWPDKQRYGEWAVESEKELSLDNKKGWDGERGPAQTRKMGWGVIQYKQMILQEEKIPVADEILAWTGELAGKEDLRSEPDDHLLMLLDKWIPCAWRRQIVLGKIRAGQFLKGLQDPVFERLIDPRAGKDEHIAENGGTCIIDDFAEENRDGSGTVVGPRMYFRQASGTSINDGLTKINELLQWDVEKGLQKITNAPRLFVSERCQQLRWAMENYTGLSGEEGACKDFIDLVRYAVRSDLSHITPSMVQIRGGMMRRG